MTSTAAVDRWLRRLFFAVALLYVLPVWTVPYLPTVDGPCHTYNAWILRQYGNVEQYPLFHASYEINRRPYPNWISQGAMALLMFAVPPLSAEKLLVSGYVLVFLAGIWYLGGTVGREHRWLSFLAFPFAYNHLLQMGFYNFCWSLALFPWVLGYWWRHRAKPDLRFAVGINLFLWLCYFSHIVSFVLCLLAIAVLWLASLRRESWRRHLLHVAILAPQLPLPLWFLSVQGSTTTLAFTPWTLLWRPFVGLEELVSFDGVQRRLAMALAGVFLLLLLLTFWRENVRLSPRPRLVLREADTFLLLSLVFTAVYFLSPERMAGGTLLNVRLSLFPFLLLIPWLSPPLRPSARGLGAAVLAVAALVNLVYLVHWYRVLGGEVQRFLSGLTPIVANTRLLPLRFDHPLLAYKVDVVTHAPSYAAIEKGLIDWDNYEAAVSFFPTRFRDSAPPPNIWEIEARPGFLVLWQWRDRADYIYTWGLTADQPLAKRLQRRYRLVLRRDEGALWKRRS